MINKKHLSSTSDFVGPFLLLLTAAQAACAWIPFPHARKGKYTLGFEDFQKILEIPEP